ncbi:hypothetical protein [Vibrio owensii]|uniref:hypothetical protein n=1 Tax=Vibrio harveyi group TaxID=717610 RepID=UPI003CC54594
MFAKESFDIDVLAFKDATIGKNNRDIIKSVVFESHVVWSADYSVNLAKPMVSSY